MSETIQSKNYVLNENIKYIISDIEGTTTSIDFVKDVLFPFARKNVKEYLEANFDNEECKEDIALLVEQSEVDSSTYENVPLLNENVSNKDEFIRALLANVFWQMDLDRKAKALKQLQGHIWKDAYERGVIKGHVYEDVPAAFQRWIQKGIKLYIYSSGSVQAQKLLFANSEFGDLTTHLSGYFDTNVGAKGNADSYRRIIEEIKSKPNESLFLTDIVSEAEAARSAGLHVIVVRRPDNANKQIGDFNWIENFNQII